MSRTLKYGALLLLLLLIAWIPLAMQRETGSIDGLITDDRGPVVNASLEARNVVSSVTFHTESDAAGYYRLESLRPGRYSLRVTAVGRDSVWIRQVVVEHGRTAHRDIHLGRSDSTTSGL